MSSDITRRAVLRGIGALGVGAGGLALFPSAASAASLTRVLVFSKTAGFRHDSIPAGIAAIRQLGAQNGFFVDATEDAAAFTTQNLAQYQAVVWLSTTGDVLDTTQQTAFESYVNGGGGYVGVHAAADTEYDWAWYGGCCGAYFLSHPAQQQATVVVEDRTSDSTAHLPATWSRFDEWYNYRTNPRGSVNVLMRLDESSYSGGTMGADHPITWWHDVGAGRAWYTGLGHTIESYSDPNFTRMLLGGIRVAARAAPSNPGDVELARGRAVTVSSIEPGTSHVGANAVDGNSGTRWSSAFADPQWISVDLGAVHRISHVRLTWETAYGRAYRMETSTDGNAWQSMFTTTTGDGGTDDIAVAADARYVRVTGTQRGTQWGYSLWELSVLGA
jgi:type 1 glutamine amidotransferase